MTNTPRKRNALVREVKVPEWMEILHQKGDYAIVKIKIDDIEKVRLLKLSQDFREYRRKIQREYRQRVKERGKRST